MTEIEEKVLRSFESVGIFVDPDENVLLADCVRDSITFISLMVEIEQNCAISIPDEYFSIERLSTYQDICNMVLELSA
ncbi:MAG: phosphopantetheine-binding protein [Spirochaetaceae bacterium]|jgi:acyl carrier protein|nr:phosphopantetheine-binding protein [Spirochaetaceae bacterium]